MEHVSVMQWAVAVLGAVAGVIGGSQFKFGPRGTGVSPVWLAGEVLTILAVVDLFMNQAPVILPIGVLVVAQFGLMLAFLRAKRP